MPEDSSLLIIILLSVGGGLALIGLIYGAIRKFTHLTWIGWQLILAFGLDIAVSYLPLDGQNIAVHLLLFTAVVALPLIIEYFLRGALVNNRLTKQGTGEKVLDHLFGALTALLAMVMFFVSIGGFGLGIAETFMGKALIEHPIWTFFSKYVLDFFLIAIFMLVIRAGCRLGVLKLLYFVLIVLLVLGSFFGFLLLFSQVQGGIGFSEWIGGWFGFEGVLGAIVGCAVATLFFSLVAFILIMLLSKLIDWSIQRVNSHKAIEFVDALLLGVVYTAAFLVVFLGVQGLISVLASGNLLSGIVENLGPDAGESVGAISGQVAAVAQKLAAFAQTSPFSRWIYLGNPLRQWLSLDGFGGLIG